MSTLVECVPNFSEGRDKAKVDAIVDAMKMPGVYLLDREMDSDHNRCVITIVGERDAIQEAAIRGVGKASELIDLNNHAGAHPRTAKKTGFQYRDDSETLFIKSVYALLESVEKSNFGIRKNLWRNDLVWTK